MTIEKGTLVRWVNNKGFGFIKPENGKSDIFIHISALAGMSRSPLLEILFSMKLVLIAMESFVLLMR